MSKSAQNRKKAIMYIAAPVRERRRYCDVSPVESSSPFCQREAIKRKAVEIGADIVGEFVIPKPSNEVSGALFRSMVETIRRDAIDYVLIYPEQPHRIREHSAKITEAINAAGAQLVSVIGGLVAGRGIIDFFLHCYGDIDKFNRRDAQLRAAWKRKKRAADAA